MPEVPQKSHMKWILPVSLAGVCLVWVLLSQVAFLTFGGRTSILGRDGLLAFLEEKTIDARLAVRGSIPSPTKVCYVNVDTDSIVAFGNFPWSRAIFAKALDALFERGKVRAVGMDFVFSDAGIPQLGREESAAGSLELGKSINKHRNVVLAATYGTKIGLLGKRSAFPFVFEKNYDPKESDLPEKPDVPVVGPTWGQLGLIDEAGEALRWVPFFASTEHMTYLPMGLKLFLLSRGLDDSAAEIRKNSMLIHDSASRPVLDIPLTFGQLVEPNWFSPWDENPQVGIFSVLEFDRMAREGDDEEKARAGKFFAAFHGAVVLIGPTDRLLNDLSEAPLSGAQPVPRVSLHGNIFKTLDSGETMLAAFKADPGLVFRNVDRVLVPGRIHPVDLHELLGHGDATREKNRARIAVYEEAKSLYARGLWGDAREIFLRAVAEEPSPGIKTPSSVMLARCDRFLARPPVENFAFPLTKDGDSI